MDVFTEVNCYQWLTLLWERKWPFKLTMEKLKKTLTIILILDGYVHIAILLIFLRLFL